MCAFLIELCQAVIIKHLESKQLCQWPALGVLFVLEVVPVRRKWACPRGAIFSPSVNIEGLDSLRKHQPILGGRVYPSTSSSVANIGQVQVAIDKTWRLKSDRSTLKRKRSSHTTPLSDLRLSDALEVPHITNIFVIGLIVLKSLF